MSLIKSISGIRGTIGGKQDQGLTPSDIVRFVSAYSQWLRQNNPSVSKLCVVVGRDARISGPMVRDLVVGTLVGMGVDVTDIGLATTPTTELAVTAEGANGGIIITASHNPKQWNALKLLNNLGEFLSAADGALVLDIANNASYEAAQVDDLGSVSFKDFTDYHINKVLELPYVNVADIKSCHFKVALDAVNSVGGLIVPKLLERLGVEVVLQVNCEANGLFAHNPEPLAANLTDLMSTVAREKADIGFAVDPDVDRLAMVSEDGTMFGEEYTLVAVADYLYSLGLKGCVVSNLSSSRALRDVANRYGCDYFAAAVGEVNVVTLMRQKGAFLGGEGNGGVILPECHSGRDALVGIALMLSYMAKGHKKPTAIRATLPTYFMSKNRIDLQPGVDVDAILNKLKANHSSDTVTDIDGVKIDYANSWVHLRKSNTEPIIRIYSEAHTQEEADQLAQKTKDEISALV